MIAKLNAEIGRTMQNADLKKTLLAQGIETRASTPQELAARLKDDTTKWHKIVETAGIKGD